MRAKIQAGIMAAFTADALALGAHWVYDIAQIKDKYGRLDFMVAPEIAPFHKGKKKGDFTHYGDQMFLLLESLAYCSGFDLDNFSTQWKAMFEDYRGWVDGATKETLANLEAGKSPQKAGSGSTDLGGASRMVPLALFYGEDRETFMANAETQTAMTHNHTQVIQSARFFASAAIEAAEGRKPLDALEMAQKELSSNSPIYQMITDGLESVDKETTQAIAGFGQMCETQAALPGTIHLISKYPNDLKTAMVENVMAGGDSSARGILCGFILGICNGMNAVPEQWIKEMRLADRIRSLAGITK
ncbi:ADP-ribosylglycohydrolase family protein [uncultured Desulfobacter sp.]|uniref:ADP-ribosylglycohydrolase family protein n=1 Tax=uncultured Desulfobacter sp. TaxID=240139 RepID=UPI0029F4E1E3|nr:ADP-ribosylglycohydrolase family protein [uncultured Desulfobacter sp.]